MELEGKYYPIVVTCINLKTGQEFDKGFDSWFKLANFENKCKYSKKIKIISIKEDY